MNEKQFIVSQDNYINQFELAKGNIFSLTTTFSLDSFKILKFPKNRFLIIKKESDDAIYLYGQV